MRYRARQQPQLRAEMHWTECSIPSLLGIAALARHTTDFSQKAGPASLTGANVKCIPCLSPRLLSTSLHAGTDAHTHE